MTLGDVVDPARHFPTRPVVGVGAVVVDGDRVLLVRRAHEPLKGQWSLPGGAVELGETIVDAITREVREETGIEIRVGPIVEVLDRIRHDPSGRVEFHYVLVDFICTAVGGTLACASDAADAKWVPSPELAACGVAETTISVIKKALSRAL